MHTTSLIRFDNGNIAQAIQVSPYGDSAEVMRLIGFEHPKPAIFISGGASAMTDEAMAKTTALVEQGIVQFAADHNIAVVDGGTDAGIMRMVGQARHKLGNKFSLIGCAPHDKVHYPGRTFPNMETRTALEPHHSHFVLVDDDHWGAESDMIVGATRALTQEVLPSCGILINGGQIAQYDVYIASARGERAMPVIVVDGSGRSADMIATASKTGSFQSAMIKAIIQGGQIDIVVLDEGPASMYDKLTTLFNVSPAR